VPDPNDPLRVLPREVDPPPALRERVRETLRSRGRLRPRRRRVLAVSAALAAAVLLFLAGRLSARVRDPWSDSRPEFVLLVYEGPGFDRSAGVPALFAEYDAWARGLQARGLLLHGRALERGSTLLQASGGRVSVEPHEVAADAGTITGFFILRAADSAQALAIARTCPHLKHGGTLILRPIVPSS
jgi:hypothetical protein